MGSHFGVGDSLCDHYRGGDEVISARFNESVCKGSSAVDCKLI